MSLEAHLRAAVAELLEVDPAEVDVTRSLISLGFDSLMAVNLRHRVQSTLGLAIPVADLLAGCGVRELAERLAPAETAAPATPERPERLPLSFGQQRLWFLEQLSPGAGAYTVAGTVRFTGRLDPAALAASLSGIVARHEALRTVFAVADGQPYQRVLPATPVPLPVTDLSGLHYRRATGQAGVIARQEAARPFDLETGPLLRARLVRLAATTHELIVAVHHIACDGWSMNLMLDELAAGYQRREPAPLTMQYADYTLWQRHWLSGTEHERQLEFWRTTLAGAPPALDLTTDRPRPGTPGVAGGSYRHTLPAGLTDPLHRLAREAGATLFMTMAAAFGALLGRLAGQSDVVLGTPIANRPDPALEPLIGFFVNTLAIRTDLSGDPSFRTLLRRVRDTTLAAYEHQDLPFEHLVDALGLDRDPSRNPLFQAMFTLQNTALPRYLLPDGAGGRLQAVPSELHTDTAKFDLTLTIRHDDEDNLRARWEFRRDLFDESTIARFAAHYQTLLNGIVADPDRPLSTLPLLDAEQRHHQLHTWNPAPAGRMPTFAHELVARRAEANPGAVALVAGDRELTYGELNTRGDALAAVLRSRGVGPDRVVGLSAQRGPELVIGLLAILKAGGAYLPLDPTYPAARLGQLLADAAPRIILTQQHLRAQLPEHAAEIVLLDDPQPPAQAPVPRDLEPDQLAYVLYTSGSTGAPKGVAVTHANLTGFLAAMDNLLGREHQTWLALTSTAFDISVLELIWTLSAGHRVVLLDESGTDVAAAVARHGVTHLQTTPSFAGRLLESAGLSTLDTLVLGGEAFSPALIDRLRGLRDTAVINGYGPTEACVYATAHRVQQDEREVPIGRPVAGARAYVLDRHAEPVPVGVTGEIYLAGHGIARGYLNQPGRTAERFLPDPHGAPGSRMYRTGDLARYRADGTIEFLGRTDHQVKFRGYRIELDEIDAVLTRHPAVRDAVTVAHDDQLVSYVVGEIPGLDAHLRQHLPTWMRPARLIRLDELPLTPNGKVDRGRLPAPEPAAERDEPVPPSTPDERLVAGIWAEVLGRADIGVHDNFFDIGGHSLLATQAMAHLRRARGVDLPLRSIFEHPTVAELAALITEDSGPARRPPLTAGARGAGQPVPLSFAQQRLWFLEQLAPETVYAIAGTVSLIGTLDPEAMAAALSGVVARHEVLRTVFEVREGTPYQRVLDPAPVPVPLTDLTGVLPADARARLDRIAEREATTPFDLATGPLLRVRLVRLADDRHKLIVAVHHIACDGWSLTLMLDELAALYAGDTVPALPVQYADYTLWQREWLRGEELARQLDFWRTRLACAPPALELPTDRPRPATPSHSGGNLWQELPAELAGSLMNLARASGATLFMALEAAFAALLSRLSGQCDVVVGTPIANRADPALEPLIGFFVNTVALRTDLSDDPGFRGLLARTRELTLAAYQHQDLPFEYLVEQLQLARDLGRNPLFQVMFTVRHNGLPTHRLPGLELAPSELDTGTAKFDLTLTVQQAGDNSLRARWEYRRDLFDEPTVARIAGHYRTLLEAAVTEPDRPLSTLPLLTAEQRRVLVEPPVPEPQTRFAHELIAARAAERPAATALVTENVALTYAELNGRADALAAVLRERGVGPDVLVSLCARRGPELIVGMLAVLKAGGAYVPLDPGYPAARLERILADARPAVLLTQQDLLPGLPPHGAATILLDRPLPPAAPQPPPALEPGHLAYVIYTSGSTGAPKGVAVSHANLSASTAARERVYDRPVTGFTLLSSVAFDTSVASIFWSLCRGATLHLPADGRQLELDHLTSIVERPDVSHLVCLPSLYRLLLEKRPARLETVIVAGEPVPPALVERHHELLPDVPLYNEYGPTEATVWSTVARCRPGEQRVPIGRTIPGWQAYILDRHAEPVPAGVPGELYLAGHGITRGYLNRPGLTAERFLPNPHGAPGSRMYRTGDLARWRADGQIEFLGRTDHQVKIRGYRVELDEIDAVLTGHPAVREAVTVLRDGVLVSYVVGQVPDLGDHVGQHLPDWMRPSQLVALDELPRLPNGKVDRGRLPAPRPARRGELQEPRTPVERRIAEVWCSLLHLENVGLDENFFELGGHSLLLVQAHELLRPLDERLRIVDLFRCPTIRTLAAHLAGAEPEVDAQHHDQRRAGRARQEQRRRRLRGAA